MLKEKGFNYVALGHIHKNNFEKNGNIIYPGSTMSLGFDELGEHGMVVGEITKDENKLEFIKLDETEFVEQEMDCTEINSEEELIEKINEIKIEENKFIYYWIVKYTFFDKRNIEFIKEHLNLDKYELREKLMIIFYELYQIGIEEKLYKEVAINV